ncbi:hypothetical protein Mal35_20040 [Gimesia maris]|uniref:AHH domain-containing protein n=1 Tax=Gimesia maris TaxID=122 RepID=UPI00118D3546|nr:AHH domain-containing protein [Gimesia maris]QDT78555.1 hypothetical protein Mal35_20040 [Gimesia maris]
MFLLFERGYSDSGYIGIVNNSADEFSDTLRATFGTYDVLPSSRLVSQADTVGGIGFRTPGTLKRNDDLLAANLGGQLEDHTPHHLLGVAEVDRYPAMHSAAELGYDVNRGSNGINLPNDPDLAKNLNKPYHPKRGRHSKRNYTGPVNQRLERMQQAYDQGAVTDATLLFEIRKIEDSVRSDLLDDTLKLNSRYSWYPLGE